MVNSINIYSPNKLAFGPGTISRIAEDIIVLGYKRLLIITISSLKNQVQTIIQSLHDAKVETRIIIFEKGEPSFADYEEIKKEALRFKTDSVAGIGGGSVMDLAKVVAVLFKSKTYIHSIAGINQIKEKGVYLICVPTTSGTGSEMSPNAILTDDDGIKKGIISPFLVPDASYVDPNLTIGLPPSVTAFTGIDALTHCIEAYANKYAHPMTDILALKGIHLICTNLKKACENGSDIEARSMMALASVYGGMCLGLVNTAAVHALAYPLGSEFKMAHGLSNAVLLPFVMNYNLVSNERRYAEIAIAVGALQGETDKETAINGINMIIHLITGCNIRLGLNHYNITESSIEGMAQSAIQVQRLLKNNVRELSLEDIIKIYKTAS